MESIGNEPKEHSLSQRFYEMEAIRGCWSARELERQINSLYYERSGLSKNKEALSALVRLSQNRIAKVKILQIET